MSEIVENKSAHAVAATARLRNDQKNTKNMQGTNSEIMKKATATNVKKEAVAYKPKGKTSAVKTGTDTKEQSEIAQTEKTKTAGIEEDTVFARYGLPFLVEESGAVVLNERAVAIKCASEHLVKYDIGSHTHERYERRSGLWVSVGEVEVMRLLDDILIRLGKEYKHQNVVHRVTAARLSSLCKMLKPHDMKLTHQKCDGLLHVDNGVLDLNGKRPKLLAHDPAFQFRHSAGVPFDKNASCPRFEKNLLGEALEPDDIALLQKYCGSMLLGPNSCHGILVIRGTPGGGKSTLVSIIEKIIGEGNVAHLRTHHLCGRFETSAFIGKRLLVGKDVPGDTLAVNGARMLKCLVGGDLIEAEVKYSPGKQQVRGDYHVIVVSNNSLRIALDGDLEACDRRLKVIDFKNPKPANPIPNLAEKLVAEEGSGLLNWMIKGAMAYSNEMKTHGALRLTTKQKSAVSTLLEDSDSLQSFVNQNLIQRDEQDISSEELLLGYHRVCHSRQWTPAAAHTFQTRIPDLLARKFRVCRRNDIQREGRSVRGFKNLALI